jgi:sodium-dependent dicarboxylate transporter 2/3/5
VLALVGGQTDPTYLWFSRACRSPSSRSSARGLLFVLPTDARRLEFTLPWREAVKIDWWIVFLYGGGIALGTRAFQTGLAEAMGRGLTGTPRRRLVVRASS